MISFHWILSDKEEEVKGGEANKRTEEKAETGTKGIKENPEEVRKVEKDAKAKRRH